MSAKQAESKAAPKPKEPKITWDNGTACDLFVSLHVLLSQVILGSFGLGAAFDSACLALIAWAPPTLLEISFPADANSAYGWTPTISQ